MASRVVGGYSRSFHHQLPDSCANMKGEHHFMSPWWKISPTKPSYFAALSHHGIMDEALHLFERNYYFRQSFNKESVPYSLLSLGR